MTPENKVHYNHESVVRLKGEKVDLCTFRTDTDAVHLYTRWINNEDINMWIHQNIHVHPYEDEYAIVTKMANDGNFHFNIVCRETGMMIGNCALKRSPFNAHEIAIGIFIGDEDNCGKGYGREAVKLMLKMAFEDLGIRTVTLTAHGDNARAIRCYTACGFKEFGRCKEILWAKDHWADRVYMSIQANDYFMNRKDKSNNEKHCTAEGQPG